MFYILILNLFGCVQALRSPLARIYKSLLYGVTQSNQINVRPKMSNILFLCHLGGKVLSELAELRYSLSQKYLIFFKQTLLFIIIAKSPLLHFRDSSINSNLWMRQIFSQFLYLYCWLYLYGVYIVFFLSLVAEVTGETLVTRTCVLEDMNSQCGLFKFQVRLTT